MKRNYNFWSRMNGEKTEENKELKKIRMIETIVANR
jgi:hypothetical protein